MILVGSVHINRWISRAPFHLKDRKINLRLRYRSYSPISPNFYFYLQYRSFAKVQIVFDEGQRYSDSRI
jgi:hypothetical protein